MTNADEAKGRVKKAAGDLTDDDELKNEGKMDEMTGKAKEMVDGAREKVDDMKDAIKDKFSKDS